MAAPSTPSTLNFSSGVVHGFFMARLSNEKDASGLGFAALVEDFMSRRRRLEPCFELWGVHAVAVATGSICEVPKFRLLKGAGVSVLVAS